MPQDSIIQTSPKTATLEIGERRIELPVIRDKFNLAAVDVTGLYPKYGVVTYDNGFASTARAESEITFIDGDKGILLYRGYPIEQLASQSDFMETAYLLLNGNLPTLEQSQEFNTQIIARMPLHDQMIKLLERYPRNAHPMAIIGSMVLALTTVDDKASQAPKTKDERYEIALNLIAKMPTIVASVYRHTTGKTIIQPSKHYGYTENFMRMCFADADGSYTPNLDIIGAMDRILILHADHEQNASTSTVRMAGSTGAPPYGAIAAGVMALWGPSHGGANEAVLEMLSRIGTLDKVPGFIELVKTKGSEDAKLMGFGHRVYKNFDPRAMIIKEDTHKILDILGKDDPRLAIAMELENVALNDDYFKSKKLYPNVDFYSGIILGALGFPVKMFTPLFVLGRTAGWIAQWMEMTNAPVMKIDRPRQLYTGEEPRDFIPIHERGTLGDAAHKTLVTPTPEHSALLPTG